MTDLVDVLLVRAAKFGGIERAAGETLTVPASTAATLIACGRARLVDAADLGLVVDAEETRRRGVRRTERPRRPCMVLRR